MASVSIVGTDDNVFKNNYLTDLIISVVNEQKTSWCTGSTKLRYFLNYIPDNNIVLLKTADRRTLLVIKLPRYRVTVLVCLINLVLEEEPVKQIN